jgi:hypothetical protein
MDITLSIETTDQRIVRALMNGRNLTNRQPVSIGGGVEVVHVTGDAFGVGQNKIWKFVISGVTSVSLGIVSSYIYDRIKDASPPVIMIDNRPVTNINASSITTVITQRIEGQGSKPKSSKALSAQKKSPTKAAPHKAAPKKHCD